MSSVWPKWRGAAPSRRAFLGGSAAALTLPWLASLDRAHSRPPKAPVRFVAWFSPCGFVPAAWLPPVGPLGEDLPRTLQAMATIKDDLLVVSGFDNRPTIREFQGDHARGTGGTLTCTECIHHDDGTLENGVSIDQAIAQVIGHATPFGSLELGTTPVPVFGTCDSGFSCAYTSNISWSDPGTPRPKIIDPAQLFTRLFAGSDALQSAEEAERRRGLRTSVLDYVLDDAAALGPRLTKSDRDKLDAYLTAVRELEQRLTPGPANDTPSSAMTHPEVVQGMNDLMVLALSYDLTRVITFMAENGGAYRYHGHLGITRAHHDLSHHGGDPEKFEPLLQIESWYAGQFAAFVEALRGVTDPFDGGPLLQNTLAVLTSEMSDGNDHLHTDIPIAIAGQGGGQLQTGRHVAFPGGPPLANLFSTLAEVAGAPLGAFGGDGTGPVSLD